MPNPRDVLAAERKVRARVRREKGIHSGGRPLANSARPPREAVTALGNNGRCPGRGGQPQADLHEGPAEAHTEVPRAPGCGGKAVRVRFGTEFGGADAVQGEMGLVLHRAVASHSEVRGKAWEWMRT